MQECEQLAHAAAQAVIAKLSEGRPRPLKLALAESCTAGLISGLLASIPGASQVLFGSYVCYAKEAKMSMLDIGADVLAHGLVSEQTACAMAQRALEKSGADIAVSVTGLAGPHTDGSDTPVGTVFMAVAGKGEIIKREFHFEGERNEIRLKAAIAALELIP